MREHSEAAWNIASLFSHALASETRDLVAHIDAAIAAERERCAKIASVRQHHSGLEIAEAIRAAG